MFSNKHYINIFSLTILTVITFFNFYRFTNSFYQASFLLSAIYIIFFLTLILFVARIPANEKKGIKDYIPVIIAVYVLLPYLLITYATSTISASSRWEEIVLVIYIILIALSVVILNKYSDPQKYDSCLSGRQVFFFLFSIFYGFLFLISKETGFLLIIVILFFYRNSIPKILLFSFIALIVGLFIPDIFLLFGINFNRELFFPEISLIPQIFILILSFYAGWIVANIQEVFFSSGIILFMYLIFGIFSNGYGWKFYLVDASFPSFFIAVVPFLLLSIKKYRVEKFIGKVLVEK